MSSTNKWKTLIEIAIRYPSVVDTSTATPVETVASLIDSIRYTIETPVEKPAFVDEWGKMFILKQPRFIGSLRIKAASTALPVIRSYQSNYEYFDIVVRERDLEGNTRGVWLAVLEEFDGCMFTRQNSDIVPEQVPMVEFDWESRYHRYSTTAGVLVPQVGNGYTRTGELS